MATTTIDADRVVYMVAGEGDNLNYMGAKYVNIAERVPLTVTYEIGSEDYCNAPGIAFKVYGDFRYWWVVCMCNKVLDPISDFAPGMLLRLPSLADINLFLSQINEVDQSSEVTL